RGGAADRAGGAHAGAPRSAGAEEPGRAAPGPPRLLRHAGPPLRRTAPGALRAAFAQRTVGRRHRGHLRIPGEAQTAVQRTMTDKVIVTCALTGVLANREQCPWVPYTPAEIAEEALRACE